MLDRIKKNLVVITKVFLGVLLLQFFLQTFVTFRIWRNGTFWSLIWMRKEFLIIALTIFVIRFFAKHIEKEKIKKMWEDFPLKRFVIVFCLTILVAFVISLFNSSISNFVLSIRYSMFGYFIFILFYVISYLFFNLKSEKIAERYSKIIKRVLCGALIRWGIIRLCPAFIELFGYNQWNYEWKVWEQPPVAYYTQYKDGFVRNQFLFERPISLWFFLVAFRPLFFMLVLYKKWTKKRLLRWWLYWIILLSTFSRAAWWAWFVQTVILFFALYRKQNKKLFLSFLIPIICLLGVVTYYWRDQIIYRDYSNTGHIKELVVAVNKIKEKPFLGQWAASAGPASHHLEEWQEYNPENQYLQIWLEYWLIAFIGRMALYLYMNFVGFKALKKDFMDETSSKEMKNLSLIIFAFSLWMIWLSIEWLVLHSFVDRMIVYPFTALFGIYLATYYRAKLNWTENKKALYEN